MDPLSAVTGIAALAVLAVVLGWPQIRDMYTRHLDRKAELEQETQARLNPAPICQCGHGLAFHTRSETGGGACAATEGAAPTAQECRCQQYIGPQPLPQFHV